MHSPCSFPRPGFWIPDSGFCLCGNSFWMIDQLMKCLKRCQQYHEYNVHGMFPTVKHSVRLSVCHFRCHFRSGLPVPLPVMTSGATSGHDFWCPFRSWLPVLLPVMTSGHDFRYHFRSWLLVPLPVMTFMSLPVMTCGATSGHDVRYHLRLWLPDTTYGYDWVMAHTTSSTISGHDIWKYHVALNCCILDYIKNSVSQPS